MEKAYEICVEMFEQRGYTIIDSDEYRILANKPDGAQICAFFTIHKFNIDRLQEFIAMMKKMDVWHCIIVYRENATPVAKKIVLDSKEMIIELFELEEMQYNITKHYLVPKHEKVPESEKFEKKIVDKLPILLKSDPVSRFYGFKKGDLIKVIRKNNYIFYRRVV
jgi:DNA-directed RNA polymerase I, II, and III subunit RPABC1